MLKKLKVCNVIKMPHAMDIIAVALQLLVILSVESSK
jgi:hypothetical protein